MSTEIRRKLTQATQMQLFKRRIELLQTQIAPGDIVERIFVRIPKWSGNGSTGQHSDFGWEGGKFLKELQ